MLGVRRHPHRVRRALLSYGSGAGWFRQHVCTADVRHGKLFWPNTAAPNPKAVYAAALREAESSVDKDDMVFDLQSTAASRRRALNAP
jgi:hypothetical protein